MRRTLLLLALLLGGLFVGPALAAEPDGTTPQTALPLRETASGQLVGSPAGAFRYYTLTVPAAGVTAGLTLTFSPGDPATANAVGVELWQAGQRLATMNGVGPAPGTNTLPFVPQTTDPILVQVYNYAPGTPVAFTLTVQGLAQPSATPTPAATPTPEAGSAQNPLPLTAPQSGVLPGNPAGRFVHFQRNTSSTEPQTVRLTVAPPGADITSGVFLNVYQDGTLLVSQRASETGTPGTVTVTFVPLRPGPVLVQLANYNLLGTITYTIQPGP